VDHDFQDPLYAPDPAEDWELIQYVLTAQDLVFAQEFIDWNDLDHDNQRVDACAPQDGDLLLVELEDFTRTCRLTT
jgi:hypothetical protein